MKIIIIGPVYPFRGGIAHYTADMTRTLERKHDVTVVSFSLLYPKILYPGTSQKDTSPTGKFIVNNPVYLINSINPLSYIKTAKYIKKQNPDLIIFQWWHPFFAPAYYSILFLLQRKHRVLFICHNVLPHENFPLKNIMTKAVLKKGNYFIVQSPLDEENLLKLVPNANYKRTLHPVYNFEFSNIKRNDARNALKINSDVKVLLFFGLIREYKGLKHLIRAMPKIAGSLQDVHLLIVGEIFGNEEETYLNLISQTGCSEKITLVNKYIPDEDVEQYFIASDLVVLPYESATQSGIVQIAFGFGKPVVVTNVGGLPDAVIDNKTGFVVPPYNSDAIADAVIRFFTENKAADFSDNIKESTANNSWEKFCSLIEELSNELDDR